MSFELKIFIQDYDDGHNGWGHIRFAVVNLDKSEDYPKNFVSMLPLKITANTAFTKFFGNESLEIARKLLTKSLKKEHRAKIKAEIERRLNRLEPNPVIHIKCSVCKKFFQTEKERVHKQKICPECMKRYKQKRIN